LIREVEVTNTVSVESVNNGLVDTNNSSSASLGISVSFPGDWTDTLNHNTVSIGVVADQDSAASGLEVQWSADGVSVTQDDTFSIFANKAKTYTFSPANRFLRVVYTNGILAQTSFSLQTILKKGGFKASSHRLEDALVDDDDAEVVKAVLTAKDLNGAYDNIRQFRGALNVHQSDVHRFIVNRHFSTPKGTSTTLTVASVVGDITISVADTAGFVASAGGIPGSSITINDVGEPNGAVVTAITSPGAPGVIQLDRPLDNAHANGTVIDIVEENIAAVNGTLASPIIYSMGPPSGEIWHILRMLLSSTFSSASDDSKFGNQTALTNGLVIRQQISGVFHTITNWKSNADMKRDMFDLPDTSKSGGGLFGINGRWTFKNVDFVPELIGDNGDTIQILSQDALSLSTLELHAQGHKVGQ
jgi:hypothetical protein